MFGAQDASDSAGKGHRHRVHQEQGLQVRAGVGSVLPPVDRVVYGLLQLPGAPVERLQEDPGSEPGREVLPVPHRRVHRRVAQRGQEL